MELSKKSPRGKNRVEIFPATTKKDVREARSLFEEYASSLDFSLAFQDFQEELVGLPGGYAAPGGCLLLAMHQGRAAGCVALRRFEAGVCEMKRLYVRPPFRDLGIGRGLTRAIIEKAREVGYSRMRLDTVPAMKEAQALYESLGFRIIPPNCHNPVPGAVFLELNLKTLE
jgi:putative acetyltransferase